MSYLNVVDVNDSKKWDEIVSSFQEYDLYYMSNYTKTLKIHGDGEPQLLNFETDELRGINVFMKRDISQFEPLKKIIEPGSCFDIVTPYGFGGFLFEGDTSEVAIERFYKKYVQKLKSENVISEFIRYHPIINNANCMRSVSTVLDLGKTISIDLESMDLIWKNFSPNNRNNIRRAEKSGVMIFHKRSMELLDIFKKMYNTTMDLDNANSYYYFKRDFYKSIHTDLNDNYELFYAVLDDKIIAMSIFFFINNRMHCHLSTSVFEYRYYAPTNLLFYEAAKWGFEQGFKTMHIGGGVGSEEDDLFRFKKSFNRLSDNTFSVGKEIINQEVYNHLVKIRKEANSTFDTDSHYFPLYRA